VSALVFWWFTVGALASAVGWKRAYSEGFIRTRWWLLAVTAAIGPLGWWAVWPTLDDDYLDTHTTAQRREGEAE
jgi:hypothetical protein